MRLAAPLQALPEPTDEAARDAAMQLLLCAHAERQWLSAQVCPLVAELEEEEAVPGPRRGAALASLRSLWNGELELAARTEAAYLHLPATQVASAAREAREGVRALRGEVARRTESLLRPTAPR